jgi:hypothetical protein
MVYGVLTLLVAMACAGLAAIAFKLKLRTLRFAVVGLAIGCAIGFVTAFVLGYLRFELPSVQLGNVLCISSIWLPAVFGIGGMVIGITAAMLPQRAG